MAQRRPTRGQGRRVNPKERVRQGQEEKQNKAAIQAVVIGVVVLGIFMGLVALAGSSDDGEPKVDRKRREKTGGATAGLADMRTEKPTEESEVPMWLASQFMIALGEDDPDRAADLFWWDKLFELIDEQNNIDTELRYANVTDEEKQKRQDKYLLKVFDPDYVDCVAENLLEGLVDGSRVRTAWGTYDIEAEWGNVSYKCTDEITDENLLEVLVRTQLLPGHDAIRDAQNKDAWKIVGLRHESRIKLGRSGKRVIKRRKDFGEGFYKKPRKKKKRGPVGPPEATPAVVDWLNGTSSEMQARVNGLVVKLNDDNDVRGAVGARDELIEIGKTALPGVLSAIATMDYKEADASKVFQLVQVLQEVTGHRIDYRPASTRQGFGMGGMTKQTPEERERAIRRWFGWWETTGLTWVPGEKAPEEEETWDDEDEDS